MLLSLLTYNNFFFYFLENAHFIKYISKKNYTKQIRCLGFFFTVLYKPLDMLNKYLTRVTMGGLLPMDGCGIIGVQALTLGERLSCCLTEEPQIFSIKAAVSDLTKCCQMSATKRIPPISISPTLSILLLSTVLPFRDTVLWIHDIASWSTKCMG